MQDATQELAELARLTGMRGASSPPPDWSAVTAALGHDVPSDYRQLIETHGAGLFNDYLQVYGPEHHLRAFDLAAEGLYWNQYFQAEWRRRPETRPAALGDRDITVITWGSTEDAVYCHWIVESGTAPERWPTAFHTVTGNTWEFHHHPTVALLHAFARGDLASKLIPPYPPDEPVTYTPYSA